MKPIRPLFLAAVLAFCLATFHFTISVASASTLTFEDMRHLELAKDAQISPDGKTIAVTLLRYNFEQNSRSPSLVLIDLRSRRQVTITTPSAHLPRWSPNGRMLAFVAPDSKHVSQVFVRRVDDQTTSQVSHVNTDVEDLSWSPESRNIAFIAATPYKSKWLSKYGDAFEADDISITSTSNPDPAQLFVVRPDGAQQRQLTFGRSSVTVLGGWTGHSVLIGRSPDATDAHSWKTRIEKIDATTGRATQLTSFGAHFIIAGYNRSGKILAFSDGETASPLSEQALFAMRASRRWELTRRLDRNVQWAIWTPDDAQLVVAARDRTRITLWTVGLDGSFKKLNMGNVDVLIDTVPSISRSGRIAFVGSTPRDFGNIYVYDLANSPHRMTHLNPTFDAIDMGSTSTFTWRGPDGFVEDAVITYPPRYSSKRSYPAVIMPPGGPGEAMNEALSGGVGYHEFFALGWLRQMLAQSGYIVFEPNYRGCDSNGRRYLLATIDDLLAGPGRDIVAGLKALEKRVRVDRSRVAITGHSEGGLFTAYLAAAYPDLWKTGVAVDGDYDLRDEYNYGGDSSGNQNGVVTYLLGSPWTNSGLNYERNSPVTYAHNIRIHLLLMHFQADPAVPLSEGYKERRALLDNHVPVTMVIIPGGEHFPSDPVHQREAIELWFDWLRTHL